MTTDYFKKKFVATPSLEPVNLITKYNSYLKLMSAGFFGPEARNMSGLGDEAKFLKAKRAYANMIK